MTTPSSVTPGPPVLGRRSFFSWAAVALGGLASAALAVPFVGYLLGPLWRKQEKWVKLGPLSKFPLNETLLERFESPLAQAWDGRTAYMGVYVRYLGQEGEKHRFLVLAMNCAHLGCPVSWFAGSGLFMCPCHGGVYYENGERASGPPTRGMFPVEWRVKDGELEVQAPHFPTLADT